MMEATDSLTSTSLIRNAKANDAQAWHRLVHAYGRRVYRWGRLAGLQPADASNIVQEVLRSVARSLPDFQHGQDGNTFRGWIRTITRNKINDHYRRKGKQIAGGVGGTNAYRQLCLLASPGESDRTAEPTDHERHTELARLQMEFSKRDWQVFWRATVDGQPAPEVADEFGMTANAVRIVKMRVLKKLKDLLAR